MLKAVLFDLDGTLLPMNEEEFTKGYFGLLSTKLANVGYEREKLINTVWSGTKAMLKNNGQKTNEQVFWEEFAKIYGDNKLIDKDLFDDFYTTDFKKTKVFCGENDKAKKVVQFARKRGLKTILSSNPVFPRTAMVQRMNFVGLQEKDFDYITSYDNCHFCKPNPNYFSEILTKNNLQADEVILFGNSEKEDCDPAIACGISCYLVGDCISLAGENPKYKIITYDELPKIVDKEIKNRQKN